MNLQQLSDAELIAALKSLVGSERRTVAAVLRHLNEMDRRRIASKSGFPSLFEYCVNELKYAHGETARRIHAARAASKYKILYRMLEQGHLSLTVVSRLAPHLKWDNYRRLIRSSVGRSTREVEALIASLNPVPAAPAERIRYLAIVPSVPEAETNGHIPSMPQAVPAPAAVPALEAAAVLAAASEAATPQSRSEPRGAPAIRRVHFSFTGDEALLRDYERAKELSRHKWPAVKIEDVFAGALKALLAKIDPDLRARRKERARRLAVGARTRSIATAIKDEVWRRDGGRCSFEAHGRKCGSRAGLQFDHIFPWSMGGSSDAANIRLLCRSHNALEARRAFGAGKIDAMIAGRRSQAREDQRRLAPDGEI